MKFRLMFIFLVLMFTFSLGMYAQQAKAYAHGEQLKFKVKYGWFKTSEATLSVKNSTFYGKPVHHISGFGKTTGMLDIFFKVRDYFESYIDTTTQQPQKFIRKTSEGGYIKDKMLLFFPEEDSVEVHDYKHSTVSKHYAKPGSQDLLSALYALRNQVNINNIKVGQEFHLNLFFDEENFGFKAKYLGEEVLETDFGKVNTLIFRPYVQAERVFKEEESVTIWISKDKNKIPLKIEAELAVGSLTATLQEFRGLSHAFSSLVFDR